MERSVKSSSQSEDGVKPMILWKYFSRPFLLATNEIWYRGERLGKYEYAKRVPSCPYIVSVFRDGMSDYYYAEEGKRWIKNEVWRLHDAGVFPINQLVAVFQESVDVIRIIRERKEPLSSNEISEFSDTAERFWVYLTALWFAIEDLEERKETEYLDLLLDARKYGESGAVWVDEIFQRTISASCPGHKKYEKVLTIGEIASGDIPAREVLESRLSGYYLYEGKLEIGALEDAEKTCACHLEKEVRVEMGSGIIQGNGAQSGFAKGRVRLVRSKEDMKNFAGGEIIVSPTTTPDFMPVLMRCAAIVTDEGGIVSHASITSRELKKPCVIGTKIATQVLKDGDLVEVDADRGVVRILEKKEGDRNATVPSQQKIRVEDWQPTITRNLSFWQQCLSSRGHFTFSESFGVDTPCRFLAITRDGTMTTLFSEQTNLKEYTDAVMRAVGSLRKIRNLREKYESFADEFLLALYRCEADTSAESWEQFVYQNMRYSAGLSLTSMIGREGASRLTSILRDTNIDEVDIPSIMAVITYPNDWTPLFRSRLDLLEIGKKIQGDELPKDRVETLLQGWLDNHGYIPVNYCEEPWAKDDVKKQLNEALESDCAAELDRLRREQAEKQAEKRRILKEIDDETVSTLAYAIAEGTYLNEFRKNVFSRVSLGYRGIFSRVAEMAGSDNWRDCFYLTPEEMRDIISGKEVDIEAKKQERQVIGYIPNQDGSIHFLTEEETNAFSDFLDSLHGGKSEEKREVTEISGFIANTGKVRGIVKVILSSKDFEKMEAGNILVTAMTSVDFVPIMERAGAFVTNEGGVTSHAAIVSREMGKPCIIGTKIATQALHDGDLVEVDAEEGVVRVLKSE